MIIRGDVDGSAGDDRGKWQGGVALQTGGQVFRPQLFQGKMVEKDFPGLVVASSLAYLSTCL
jgi:hypothetical protein